MAITPYHIAKGLRYPYLVLKVKIPCFSSDDPPSDGDSVVAEVTVFLVRGCGKRDVDSFTNVPGTVLNKDVELHAGTLNAVVEALLKMTASEIADTLILQGYESSGVLYRTLFYVCRLSSEAF